MPEAIDVAAGIVVPASAQRMSVARSSGPGGQNVNKVASKVELRVDPRAILGLGDAPRTRLLALARRRLDADGWIVVVSQRTRDQHRNLDDARAKVRGLIEAALAEPKKRRRTRPTTAARLKRLTEKKRRSERKQGRSPIRGDD